MALGLFPHRRSDSDINIPPFFATDHTCEALSSLMFTFSMAIRSIKESYFHRVTMGRTRILELNVHNVSFSHFHIFVHPPPRLRLIITLKQFQPPKYSSHP